MNRFPFPGRPGVGYDRDYLVCLRGRPLLPVTLPAGQEALLVTRHQDVKTVLSDARFSRAAWNSGALFAREPASLALATSDPPTHTRRRRAVQAWFTGHRAAEARPRIEAIAARLLDEIEAKGPPVDLIRHYTTPLPYAVNCAILGIPETDLSRLVPWATRMMSAGRFPADEVASAHRSMHGYFRGALEARRRAPGDDLLSALRGAELDDQEIVVMGAGLLMAGGETTANHLGLCVRRLLADPGLMARLRDDPALIPPAVEELLRWIWFFATGGQPHVVLEDTELCDATLRRGQVVVPLTDAANRDPDAFADPDSFRPDRTPNPHVGFGHGRHFCLGAAHARVELQVGIESLLRRFEGLRLAAEPGELEWTGKMFLRGLTSLPITW